MSDKEINEGLLSTNQIDLLKTFDSVEEKIIKTKDKVKHCSYEMLNGRPKLGFFDRFLEYIVSKKNVL